MMRIAAWLAVLFITASLLLMTVSLAHASEPAQFASPELSGQQQLWHKITLTWHGPVASESDDPSPFLDYRLDVTFEHQQSGKQVVVPGYFAADGKAAETSAEKGDCWRVHFSPNQTGTWSYRASMHQGDRVAVVTDLSNYAAVSSIHGSTGTFDVIASDKQAPDWRYHGLLAYVGQRYLRCSGTGRPFIKAGTDSPETVLGYADFDGTYRDLSSDKEPRAPGPIIPLPSLDNGLHRFAPHVADWNEGDPTWTKQTGDTRPDHKQTGNERRGKGLIGGINYLSSRGVNSLYFLAMNVNGDGRNVWPWRDPWQRTRFDCSKLDQWEIVFSHLTKRGLMMHVVTQETENDTLLDGGDLGDERKLYYRELIARFAHHPAVCWNLGEENVQSVSQRLECAKFIQDLDPYDHAVVIHNDHWHAKNLRGTFDPLLGNENITGTSIQDFYWNDVPAHVGHYVKASAAAGHPWVVCADEMGGANLGTLTDDVDPDHELPRKFGLWGTLMAGGAGVEWYFGWDNNSPDSDLSAENWRTRQRMFDLTKIAVDFLHEHTDLANLQPHADLVQGIGVGCLADPGKQYLLYLPNGGATRLKLPDEPGRYEVHWFNPREGGPLQQSQLRFIRSGSLTGDSWAWTGEPPSDTTSDWVVLIRRVPESASPMVFPAAQWATTAPEEMGVDPAGLQHALKYWKMQTGETGIDETVVIRRGVLIHQGSQSKRPHNIYSCTKSFTSTLLGILIDDNKVRLDTTAADLEPLLKPGYSQVQLKHFATMTSGYSAIGISRWNDPSEDWSDTPYRPDVPFFAPGKEYAYWDEAQMMFARVLTRAAKQDLLDLMNDRIAEPLQMRSLQWGQEGEIDGTPIRNGCTGITLHASDLARFGHLMLNRGRWNGKELISPRWVDQATRCQVGTNIETADTDRRDLKGAGTYGYNWWTNGVLKDGKRLMPDAPPQAYFAAGLKHNICLVIPEWEMVIVRMGEDHNPVQGHASVLNQMMRKLSLAIHPL
jgi:CubicO group peptidase (beta-lactamase class C family)